MEVHVRKLYVERILVFRLPYGRRPWKKLVCLPIRHAFFTNNSTPTNNQFNSDLYLNLYLGVKENLKTITADGKKLGARGRGHDEQCTVKKLGVREWGHDEQYTVKKS